MGKWQHRLSDIDETTRLATCAVCGPTTVRRHHSGWRCNTSEDSRGRRKPRHRKFVGKVCGRCGFVPEDICQLDVDHIDNDHSNDDPANLQTLCANCHRLKSKEKAREISRAWYLANLNR